MNPIERIARSSGPGYLEGLWVKANGTWMAPREDEIRGFLAALSREVETR